MQKPKVRLSIRYKLLILLTSLPLLSLSLYLLMATRLFETDKIAYVFDSSVGVSRALSMQIRIEVDSFLAKAKPIVEGYNYVEKKFSPMAQDLFLKQTKLDAMVLYQFNEGKYGNLGYLSKELGSDVHFDKEEQFHNQVRQMLSSKQLTVQAYLPTGRHIAIGYRLGEPQDPGHLILIGLYHAQDLVESFASSGLYQSVLLNNFGQILLGPLDMAGTVLESQDPKKFFGGVLTSKTPEGTAEVKNDSGRESLVSYSQVGLGDLTVASVVAKKEALKATEVLVAKSLLFFVALISSTVIISVFASIQLTSTLRELFEATKLIAQGNFDVRVKSRSNDEVGGLAESFNWMAGEVSRLLSETAEKARMQSELATVKTVQETLFPPSVGAFGSYNIVGYFEPASECGGDWWNYSKVGNKIYLWIGDATGHGAPAALITSAARSAAAIIETFPDVNPAKALEMMNRAIHETSKGQINMTFFIAMIDVDTNVMTYSSASHDPPFLVRPKEGKTLTRRDLLPLVEASGKRLGELRDSKYENCEVKLEPGDSFIFYTDGIVDLRDPKGNSWGERTFLKTIVECTNEGGSAETKIASFKKKIADFRNDATLIDDITLFVCQYEKAA